MSFDWWQERIHPEDRDRVLGEAKEILVKGFHKTQYRLRHENGLYRYIEDCQRLLYDDLQQPSEIVGVWTDITDHKEIEGALRKSEERFREMLDSVELVAIILDAEGQVTFCNEYLLRVTGWGREEVLGVDWYSKCISDFDRDRFKSLLMSFDPKGFRARDESQIRTKSGEVRSIVWNNTALRDTSNNLIGIACIGEDVTERLRLQEQLLQSQKMESLGALAGGVAHDFNNLLTGILGYAELSRMKLPEDSTIQPYLKEVCKSAERAAALTKQLLTFARKESIEPQVVSLIDLVKGLRNLVVSMLGVDIDLVITSSADLGRVRIDPPQFEQVILNLAHNARDAMPNGGRIVIDIRNTVVDQGQGPHRGALQPGSYVVLSFTDNGHGMSKEVQARAFDPFFTTKQRGKGTGLGLAMCYGIVSNNGGEIRVYSEVDVGTVFRIYFARVDDAPRAIEPQAVMDFRGHGETILIVEDEDSVRSLAVEVLTMAGYHVLQAPDGSSALELVTYYTEPIRLLITDMIMPGMRGGELSEAVRLLRPEIEVLFISGFTDDNTFVEDTLAWTSSFLQKPFSPAQLARKVSDVLDPPAKFL